jgi:hypothetical protein
MGKKIIKLDESDLTRIVKRVIEEDDNKGAYYPYQDFGYSDEQSYLKEFIEADDYAEQLYWQMDKEIQSIVSNAFSNVDFGEIISNYQDEFRKKYNKFSNIDVDVESEYIDSLMSFRSGGVDFDEIVGEVTIAIFEAFEKKRNQ